MAVALDDPSQVGEARRFASAVARRLGFDETGTGRVALVVTELATNLVKHAPRGVILLHPLERDAVGGLEVLALDHGPGLDLQRCLRDGFSTAGTSGTGLGAVVRLSDSFDAWSSPERGTALLARLWARPAAGRPTGLDIGAVHLPKPGERVCGDSWAVEQQPGRALFLVADGLGHGPSAADASREAVRVFREHLGLPPAEIVHRLHQALRSTRGAAVAVAELVHGDRKGGELRFAGVGNIAATIFAGGASRSAMSHNGTVGHELRKVQELSYPFPPEALLVIHSDGLATHWRLDKYPGLIARNAGVIAGVLYRDFKRGRDDVTVVVARERDQANR